jgi:hypothetical protein
VPDHAVAGLGARCPISARRLGELVLLAESQRGGGDVEQPDPGIAGSPGGRRSEMDSAMESQQLSGYVDEA